MTEDNDFKVIRSDALSDLTEVRIYAETAAEIAIKHPEFAEQELPTADVLAGAIANPLTIHQSTTSQRSVVFVSDSSTHLGNHVIVPVKKIAGTTSGRVQTAYFASDYAGDVLWSAPDEQ